MRIGLLYPRFYPAKYRDNPQRAHEIVWAASSTRVQSFAEQMIGEGIEPVVYSWGAMKYNNVKTNGGNIPVYHVPFTDTSWASSIIFLSRLFKKNKIDILQASPPPISFCFHGLCAKPPHYILDVRDPVYLENQLVDYLRDREIERICCLKSDLVFSVTADLKRLLAKRYWISENKIKFIPNGALDIFKPSDSTIRRTLDIPEGATLITYLGAINRERGFYEMIPLMKKIIDKQKDIFFLLAGWGNCLEFAKKNRSNNLAVYDGKPIDEMPPIINASDICLTIASRGRMGKKTYSVALPSKTYEYLACRKPILCLAEKNSELWRFVKSNKVGVCIENICELPEAIKYLMEHRSEAEWMAERGYRLVSNKYMRANIVKKTIKYYDYVLNS